jgi:hypothetical protein
VIYSFLWFRLVRTAKTDAVIGSAEGEGEPMDFIETVVGIAPDGGSGLLELLLFVIPIAGVWTIRALRKRTRKGVGP